MSRFCKKGFTLVELIVVLVIIGILAAVGIPTASHFIKLAEMRKNEENAKTAYLAAESALTWYRNSGEWEVFCDKVLAVGTPNNTFDNIDEMDGRIYALSINNDAQKDAAMELLDGNISSKDFFDAAITIEIDVKTGQVYSTFYATRCQRLSYDGTDADGVLNISAAGDNRTYDNRRGRLLGYYSVEDYVNVVELKPVRLKVTTINLVNSETLSLNWASNSRHDNLDVKFLITFYNNEDGKELFSTEIDGTKRNEITQGQNKAQMVSLELKVPLADGSTERESIGTWSFPLDYQSAGSSGGRFSLVLDGMMTAELMEALEAKSIGTIPAGTTPAQQYSTGITRLGDKIPALQGPLDIYAEIQVEPTYNVTTGEFVEYEPSSKVKSNVENTLYDEGEIKNGRLEARISRFRHLSNIRYYNKEKSAEFTLTARNLDWTSAGAGMYGMELDEVGGVRKFVWNGTVQEGDVLDFPSIEMLSSNHTLKGGAFTSISNLKLGKDSVPDDSLIEKLYSAADRENHKTRYLGLFCEAEGTIKNLTLSNPILTLFENSEGAQAMKAVENFDALDGVGILCGRSQGTLTDISVKTTEKDRQILTVCLKDREEESSSAEDKRPAGIGGLVGVLAGRKEDGTLVSLNQLSASPVISNLTVEGSVTGILPAPLPVFNSGDGTEKTPEQRAEGYSYGVGGIFGYGLLEEAAGSASDDRVHIENCKNHAGVKGNLFTGGICGYLKDSILVQSGGTSASDGSISKCENDGLILCLADYEEEDARLEGRYFGGILGFGHKVQINDSSSASGRARNYSYDYAQKDTVLLGQYVGGIIGYGNSCQVAGCKTEKGGYVLGSNYVGGIAGGLSNDAGEAITGTTGTSGVTVTTNAGYVIGNRYVGGIVGKNDGDSPTTITNCINNGVAAGYERYIGGIVGYNGDNGYLLDCASYISDYSGTLLKMIVEQWKAGGDCSGGLVGYNNGGIEFTDESQKITVRSVSSIVVGKDYVGGVIGFNDIKGTLQVNYTLIGGQIHADGNGVGGCIGLNASTAILTQELSIKPSSVTGNYYVGGCIGANVVDLVERTREKTDTGIVESQTGPKDVTMDGFKADNTLGSITGKAFTGGVIGYQRTYTQKQLNDAAGIGAGKNISLLDYLNITEGKEADGNLEAMLPAAALPLLPKLDETLAEGKVSNIPTRVLPSDNTCILTIGNKYNSEDSLLADNNNVPVYCDLYTGGIVGYCERNSELVIVNCRNSGRLSRQETSDKGATSESGAAESRTGEGVSLKAYLESDEVNADVLQMEEDVRVSIGGGILGANLDHQVIDHCENAGTLNGFIGLGGIVGFNAGGVFNCVLSDNFGNAGLNYIGGIVGLNVQADSGKGEAGGSPAGKRIYADVVNKGNNVWEYTSGLIAACSTKEGVSISGRSFVGGIAGYNLSGAELRSNQNQAGITAAGDYAGSIAGANLGKIYVSESSTGREYTVAGNNGQGIGGIVGWNRSYGRKNGEEISDIVCGSIYVTVSPDKEVSGNGAVEVVAIGSNVSVTGREKVGGIIGINEGIIDASGDGTAGTLGGSGKAELVCRAKLVRATQDCAGGIIGEARAGMEGSGSLLISRAVNRAERVTADNGRAGGIVAVNNTGFTLQECRNLGDVNSDQGYAGGITAENYGQIVKCSVGVTDRQSVAKTGSSIEIRSQGADAIGAVCAVNYGTIWDSGPAAYFENGNPAVEVILSGTARLVGGIAGKNAVGGENAMAGVIGRLTDSDYKMNYMPKIEISASALTVGGAAGVNESDGTLVAEIRDITAEGLSFEGFTSYQYLGGIVGENQGKSKESQALVADCLFNDGKISQKSGSETGNCYGGVAGKNSGRLENCQINKIDIDVAGVYTATATSTAKDKENYASHIGGIAGKNEESGVITGCLIGTESGKNEIDVANGMAGGIAGYNKGSIVLSGDAVTDDLMDDGKIGSVQSLIDAAAKQNISKDSNYVTWSGNALEDQSYAGNGGKRVNADRSLSLIVSANGNLGGITAYNAPTGEVNYCATGNWYLNNKSAAIGVGTGGIIGMNESERNLSFLLNQAFVGREIADVDTNRFAGGIIGNQNNTTTSGWTIQNSVNYGTVYCRYTHYSGGIIGQWTGSGGNIENCQNFGNLQTTYGPGWVGAAGGIVAQLYHAYEGNEYNITGCKNFGNIYGKEGKATADSASDSAGILGNVTAYKVADEENGQKYTINVTDCVNGAGVEIYSFSMASGIVGFFSCDEPTKGAEAKDIEVSTANIVLNTERCRNYAAVLQGKNFVAGIFGDRYGETGSQNTILKYCFSVNQTNSNYNQVDCPIISYKNGNSKPAPLNGGADVVYKYNYFLSNNTVNSFNSGRVTDNTARAQLERANTGWVYSVVKGELRYFIYLDYRQQGANNISLSNLNLTNLAAGEDIKNGNTVIGRVLFTVPAAPVNYNSVNSVVNGNDASRNFDTYVRTFCYEMAGMLLAPDKVTLTKVESGDGSGDGNQFTIEISKSADAGDGLSYEAILYRKGADGVDVPIPLKNDAGLDNIIGVTTVAGSDYAFQFHSSKYTFELSEEEINAGGEIRVGIKAVKDNKESEEVKSNLVAIGNTLPEPELRIELIERTANSYAYRLFLENQGDYKDGQVSVKLMDRQNPVSFDVDKAGEITLTGNSLQQLVVQVKSADGVKASLEVSVPVYLPAYTPEIALKNQAGSSGPTCKVDGTNLQDLRIQVTIPGSNGKVTTPPVYRAEIIGTWKDENGKNNTNTVFQSMDILTTASGDATAVFADLPEYMASASNVRVRIWYAESGLGPVYTYSDKLGDGTAVGETTANVKILKGVTKENPGGDWEYAYTPVLTGTVFENYRWESNVLFTLLPAPVLMDNQEVLTPETEDETGHLQYTFAWDEATYQSGDEYIVSLAGIVRDENGEVQKRVSILTNKEMPEKENGQPKEPGNLVTLDAENWSYNEVELTVTRKGNANQTQVVIGQTSTETYRVKQRLPQPAQPKVAIISKDELHYEIEWDAITPEEGCEKYVIYVQPYNEDKVTLGERVSIAEIPVTDADGNPTAENGVYKETINLEIYAGNRVLIYVKALPADDDELYVHSVDGITYGMDVPARLAEPQIDWDNNWKHEKGTNDEGETVKETVLTVEDFQNGGMTVKVKADEDSIPPGDSAYLLKAFVFESSEQAERAKAEIESGAVKDIDGLLDVYPALNEDELIPVSMEAQGTDGMEYGHNLSELSAEYAGRYMIFYARISSGEGNISSPWVSSEIWQMPYVKLPTPDVSEGSEDADVNVTLIVNPDLPETNRTAFLSEEADEEEEESKENNSESSDGSNEMEDGELIDEESNPSAGEDEGKEGNPSAGEDEGKEGNPFAGEDEGEEGNPPDGGDTEEESKLSFGESEGENGEPSGGEGKAEESGSSDGEDTGKESKPSEKNSETKKSTELIALSVRNALSSGLLQKNKVAVKNPVLLAVANQIYHTAVLEQFSGAAALADTVEEESEWTANHITLNWDSVELADSYYILLTAREETDGAGEQPCEFKVVEAEDGTDVSVFWKNADGDWEEITEDADKAGEYELSGYQREISGQYQKNIDYEIPYKVNLTARLRVEKAQDDAEGFSYTLILPDARSLTPKDGGNSIVDNGLQFTKSVQIYSDVKENEPPSESEAYVRSDAYEMIIGD